MFTGLIEELGTMISTTRQGSGVLLTIAAPEICPELKTGDSVAVDGVCQTVVSRNDKEFSVFCSQVSLERTTLGLLKHGASVNLERAMRADGRFDGHIVQGHVDGTGTVSSMTKDSQGLRLEIQIDRSIQRYIIDRGSVAVNGVSLTIVEEKQTGFVLYLIPETLDRTNLPALKTGSKVNIETDIVGRYIERFSNLSQGKDNRLEGLLREQGFM